MQVTSDRPNAATRIVVNLDQDAAPVIEATDVSRWYGDVVAVSQINVAIGPGVTALLGPNGSGKTTLLKMLSGLVRPSSGQVRLFGENPRTNVSVYDRFGMVPEQETPYPFLTGKEFVELNGRLCNVSNLGEATDRAIEQVDMKHAENQKIGEYSKGMRQRIKIAAALVHDPDVILMDEPLNGTDPLQRVRLIELITELGKQGKTVLVSSHVLHEVERFAQQIIVIVNGRLAAAGNFRAIRDRIDEHSRQIRVVSSDSRRLASVSFEHHEFRSIELSDRDDEMIVRVTDALDAYRLLPVLAQRESIRLYEVGPLDESLASVFSYVTDDRPGPTRDRNRK